MASTRVKAERASSRCVSKEVNSTRWSVGTSEALARLPGLRLANVRLHSLSKPREEGWTEEERAAFVERSEVAERSVFVGEHDAQASLPVDPVSEPGRSFGQHARWITHRWVRSIASMA